MERLIFHVDVNSAFLSWIATERLKEGKEDLRLIPSAVGGDPEDRRSIILAKSFPAKKYGITTGEPVALALKKCPDLVLVKGDFALYRRCSKAFKDICREYAPVVEEASIDECFLDMTGTGLLYPDPIKTAYEIKDRIRNELGFTVNVGIGPNKMLAKMAGDFEKPDKVHTLFAHEIKTKMWPLPCGDLLLCGKSSADRLARYNIRTIGQLAQAETKFIEMILGKKLGQLLHDFANGIDDSPVSDEEELPKSIGNEVTFREDVVTTEMGYKALLYLSDKAGSRVRKEGAKAGCISVTIRANDMKKHSHQKILWNPTDVTSEIYEASKELFDELWDKKTPLRLMGVSLSNLDWDGFEQATLFTESDERHEKEAKADKAIDAIREKFGDKVWRGDISGVKRKR